MPSFKTPMLQQWAEMKEQYPDCLLFFRMGDFYELFGDDAKIGSEVLHITLTARDKGGDGKMPMCGVPFHASENYIARLVTAGYKVAICEQMSAPGKGLVQREVVRVVTAGTLLRDESLTDAGSNFLLSLIVEKQGIGGAAADLSTGEFKTFQFSGELETTIPLLVTHFGPREVVLPRSLYDDANITNLIRRDTFINITCAHDWLIYIKDAEKMLAKHFNVASLDTFGLTAKPLAVKASAALLGYLRYTQKGNLEHITSLQEFHFSGHLVLDQTTLRHLEVVRTTDGAVQGSLFGVMNQTVTAAGYRLLQDWLMHPQTDLNEIQSRQDAIAELVSRPEWMQGLRETLSPVSDVERLVGRLSVGLGSPRDLRRLADTLHHVAEAVLPKVGESKAARLQSLASSLPEGVMQWVGVARARLFEEAKPTLDDGFIFIDDATPELKELRGMTSGNEGWLKEYEESERSRTGIGKLKVVYSRAFGYGIEIGHSQREKVPADYVPRQTLVNAARFTTEALVEYEKRALTALDRMVALEKELFWNEVKQVVGLSALIAKVARQVAQLDSLISLSYVAHTYKYVRPSIGKSVGLNIVDGRHPVIEMLTDDTFIPNNTRLQPDRSLQLITGPNMAGKSTYIRQVALIVLLAHTGSFVPAQSAEMGVIDRIFTRIGAHDNLRAGQSTFMVEMLEVAHILHNATDRSLIIFDEVGRGTSPEDGFSLAWAIAEASAHKGLVLFATHFHALKALAQSQPKIFNSHLAVAIDDEDLIFLRKMVDGPTDESFGIVVAEKAGVPKSIIKRAKQLAGSVEKFGPGKVDSNQLSLLATSLPVAHSNELEDKLNAIDINSLTPIEALQKLAELKATL